MAPGMGGEHLFQKSAACARHAHNENGGLSSQALTASQQDVHLLPVRFRHLAPNLAGWVD